MAKYKSIIIVISFVVMVLLYFIINSWLIYSPNYLSPVIGGHKFYRILLWTKHYETDDWLRWPIRAPEMLCPYSNCNVTDDRHQLIQSDAVVFHWRDISPFDLPSERPHGQRWVLFNTESPQFSPVNQVRPVAKHIDWFMNYRTDADIYVPYGSVNKCHTKWQNIDIYERKNRSVAWVVSNCNTPSKREDYVQRLRDYIDIDVYGKCGQFFSCDDSGFQYIANKYKFYLTFENSLCKDYVTEKLFRIIGYDIIPVVYGSANYSQIMPKKSYINVKDFDSPKHLADYLKSVSSDKQMYNSYLTWKTSYCPNLSDTTYFCDLCQKLNQNHNLIPNNRWIKTNVYDWYAIETNCESPWFQTNISPIV